MEKIIVLRCTKHPFFNTGNWFQLHLLLNTPNWCFPDGNEIESLKKDNLVTPRSDLFLQQPLKIEGLNETYHVGEKIEFTIKFNGIFTWHALVFSSIDNE